VRSGKKHLKPFLQRINFFNRFFSSEAKFFDGLNIKDEIFIIISKNKILNKIINSRKLCWSQTIARP